MRGHENLDCGKVWSGDWLWRGRAKTPGWPKRQKSKGKERRKPRRTKPGSSTQTHCMTTPKGRKTQTDTMQTTRLRRPSTPCCLSCQRIFLSSFIGLPMFTLFSSLCWILFQLSMRFSQNSLWLLSSSFCLSLPSKTCGRTTGDTGRIKKSITWIAWCTAGKLGLSAGSQLRPAVVRTLCVFKCLSRHYSLYKLSSPNPS